MTPTPSKSPFGLWVTAVMVLVILTALAPMLIALSSALVPLVIAGGVVVVIVRLVFFHTRRF